MCPDATREHPGQCQAPRRHTQGTLVLGPEAQEWCRGPQLWGGPHPQTYQASLASPSTRLGCISCTATPRTNSQGEHWTDKDSSPQMPKNALEQSHGFRSWFPRKEASACRPQEPSLRGPTLHCPELIPTVIISTLGCDFLKTGGLCPSRG